MKKTDKLLMGIVGGIVLLVVVAFAVALSKPKPTYQAEDAPEGVAFNYLFALQQKEYERAYSYLAPSLKGYPKDAGIFADDIRDSRWFFSDLENSSTAVEIDNVDIKGQRADVSIRTTHFYEGDLFSSGQYSNVSIITLRQDDQGNWKITGGNNYWLECWEKIGGCK